MEGRLVLESQVNKIPGIVEESMAFVWFNRTTSMQEGSFSVFQIVLQLVGNNTEHNSTGLWILLTPCQQKQATL